MQSLEETIKAIELLFPKTRGCEFLLRPKDLSDLPFWLKAAADVFLLEVHHRERLELTLILPKTQLTFDQIQNVYEQISHNAGPNTLLIADNLNPRYRPLLMKFRIPFIYKAETVFAPELGLVLRNLRSFESKGKLQQSLVKDTLHPFGLKLISGYLTGAIDKEFQLKTLHEEIVQRGRNLASSKLSVILGELAGFELLKTTATGPQKRFIFEDRQEIWNILQTLKLDPFMRTILVQSLPCSEKEYILAGESALSRHSDLVEPKIVTNAIALSNYNTMNKAIKARYFTESGEPRSVVQLWKEDPRLFSSSVENTINPIELYFSMREQNDERIQLALEKMLSKLGFMLPERE